MAERNLHVFVDNSNVLIEGRRLSSARREGRARLGAYVDNSYQIDWGKFLFLIKEKDTRALAHYPILYGSRPPPDDTVWERIRTDGFDVKLFDRNIRNKEKGVDMEMGMDIVERLYAVTEPKIMVIAAGDADFVPAIVRAKARKWKVEVWFWNNAAEQIKKEADRFYALDRHFEYLQLGSKMPLP